MHRAVRPSTRRHPMSRAAYPKSRWKPGMVYAVPLCDGSFGVAQAVDSMMTNIIYVAIFSIRHESLPSAAPLLSPETAVALLATWRQALNRGDWPALGLAAPVFQKHQFANESFASSGYVGAKHYDAKIIANLLSAFHGLTPWNVMADERYFESMLSSGVAPASAIILSPAERDAYRREHFGVGA